MALNSNTLASGIQSALDARGSAGDTAAAIASAYYDYAAAGLFGASVPTIPGSAESAMSSAIEAVISDPDTGTPAAFGGAFPAALAAFWAGVPVAGTSGAGSTAGCPGSAAAGVAITATVATVTNTSAAAASGIAAALHTATMTVTAALTIPPGSPVVTPIA